KTPNQKNIAGISLLNNSRYDRVVSQSDRVSKNYVLCSKFTLAFEHSVGRATIINRIAPCMLRLVPMGFLESR
ncbi:hypothetical protein ACJX0J_040803, partial [Zea mays]